MTTLLVPYHLDEYLPSLGGALPCSGVPATTVHAALPAGDPWQRLAHLYRMVAGRVADQVRAGQRPVVFSGDCTTALGIVAGLQQAGIRPGVVWFDAHGDVQTLETTASGYLGGMPLRILTGYRPELIAGPIGLGRVDERDIVLVGARDLDPPERVYLDAAAIRRGGVPELSPDGLPDRPLYLHLDVDVVDPMDIHGLRYPAPGGPRLPEVIAALHRVVGTGRVVAFGVASTVQPGFDASAALTDGLTTLVGSWEKPV